MGWKAANTHAWDPTKSRKIFQIAQYNWIILPGTLLCAYLVVYRYLNRDNGGFVGVDDSLTWTLGSVLYLILVVPSQIFGVFSMIGACFPLQPFRIANQPIQRNFNRLIICLVTRGDQPEVVKRSVRATEDLYSKIDDRISLHILTEEVNAGNFEGLFDEKIAVHGVPKSYKPRKAKYKARSLEWFRINMKIQADDWILHIDEETILDEYCLKTCIDFITRQTKADVGVGIIHYNGHKYWNNPLPTAGDIDRVQSDWGRIQFQCNWLNQVALGVHGSFIMMSGAVENAVTWDTDIVTEDYWFCLRALKLGYRFDFIPAIARELSPNTIYDYIKQRKRWFTGMRSLNQFAGNLQLLCYVWTSFSYVYLIFWVATKQWAEPIPRWFYHLTVSELIWDRVFTCLPLLLQDWDAGLPWIIQLRNQIAALWLRPIILVADVYATFDALLAPAKGFYIVDKL